MSPKNSSNNPKHQKIQRVHRYRTTEIVWAMVSRPATSPSVVRSSQLGRDMRRAGVDKRRPSRTMRPRRHARVAFPCGIGLRRAYQSRCSRSMVSITSTTDASSRNGAVMGPSAVHRLRAPLFKLGRWSCEASHLIPISSGEKSDSTPYVLSFKRAISKNRRMAVPFPERQFRRSFLYRTQAGRP